MKNQKNLRVLHKGFTLVELLVVIAIIATLAGLIIAGVSSALTKAKRLKARNAVTGLVNGVENFYADHNYLPVDGDIGEVETSTEDPAGIFMLEALTRRGNPQGGGAAFNTTGSDYYTATIEQSGRIGFVVNGNNVQGLYDPFGNPYRFIMDTDLNNRILEPQGPDQQAARILVWSWGEEEVQNDPNGDLWVYSWK